MKSRYLLIGLGYILICFFDSFKVRIAIALLLTVILKRLFDEKKTIRFEFYFVLIILFSIPLKTNYFSKGHICQIRDNYCIVNNHLYSVIVYGLKDVHLDDEIIINNEINPIHSNSNFNHSSFESYCKGNNIVGQITYKDQIVNHKSHTLRSKLFENNLKNNSWINSILFHYGQSIESESSYLIMASSMQISFFIYFIRSILSKIFYPKRTLKITTIITLFLCILFHFTYGYTRALISLIVENYIEDRKDRLGFYIILLCLFKPYYVKSMSFLIPIGIRLLQMFKNGNNRLSITMYVSIIQLYFNGNCNFIQSLLFSVFRIVNGWIYVIAFLLSVIPVRVDLSVFINFYLNQIESITSFTYSCSISLVCFFLIIICIFNYNELKRKRYLLLLCMVLLINNNIRLFCPFYTVSYIDVGQGDSALITTPFSKTGIMIDAAGNYYKDIAKDIIYPYLQQKGVEQLEVIISHDDIDHAGGLESLDKYVDILKVYDNKQDTIVINGVSILDLTSQINYDNPNDNSITSFIKLGKFNFFFTGDISKEVEKDIVKAYPQLKVDVLKLSHHGSNTASSDFFFRNIPVEFVIISAGYNNRYGHPSEEVLNRLTKYEIPYFSTADSGAICFYIFRNFMIYKTSRGQFGLLVK